MKKSKLEDFMPPAEEPTKKKYVQMSCTEEFYREFKAALKKSKPKRTAQDVLFAGAQMFIAETNGETKKSK